MPRSLQDILDHADELADRFEAFSPDDGDERDPVVLKRLAEAVRARADVERQLAAAVGTARAAGYSWAAIAGLLGLSAEGARQRYGQGALTEPSPRGQ